MTSLTPLEEVLLVSAAIGAVVMLVGKPALAFRRRRPPAAEEQEELLTFRRLRERLLTMMSLLLGIGWMAGLMASIGMKLNFLNFVAFPITFGNGVDYGVNVMRRYRLETDDDNPDAVRAAIENTGGAVILCSLTTIIGYTSLYTSANQAINSFGLAMAISEVTCVVSAVLTMPAILLLLSRRDRAADDE